MFSRIIKVLGFSTLLAAPVSAQFGMGKKKGGTFEDKQAEAMAAAGGDIGGMGGMAGMGDMAGMMEQMANMDPNDMMALLEQSMNDPATKQYMEQFGAGMEDVMAQLASMNPEELMAQITENLSQMASPDTLDSVLEKQDEVLESLLMQGLITEEQMVEFQNDPAKFKEQMSQAFEQMNQILSDPDALSSAMQMMSGMADVMANPEGAMQKLAEAFTSELGDDDKIEEARLQLLADPNAAGNPAMAALFENQDMLEILQDPIKWKEQVKKGQEMLTGGGGVGAGMGEL